jgi:hypothetical protein
MERLRWSAGADDLDMGEAGGGVADSGLWDARSSDGGSFEEDPEALRRCLEIPSLPLADCGGVAVSDWSVVSTASAPTFPAAADPSPWLSALLLLLPGIFERRDPRKDRVDSLVSDLLNEGYPSRSSAERCSAECEKLSLVPLLLFEGC